MMKNLTFAIALIFSVGAIGAAEPDPPLAQRLSALAEIFQRYTAAKEGEAVSAQGLLSGFKKCSIEWVKAAPVKNTASAINQDEASKIALSSFQTELPEDLRPKKENILSFANYQMGGAKGAARIWIVEFSVINKPAILGGYIAPTTLFVPISDTGQLLGRVVSEDIKPSVGDGG
jgi:hypothetical protein